MEKNLQAFPLKKLFLCKIITIEKKFFIIFSYNRKVQYQHVRKIMASKWAQVKSRIFNIFVSFCSGNYEV